MVVCQTVLWHDPSVLIDGVLLLYVHGRGENVRNLGGFCEREREAVAKMDVLRDEFLEKLWLQ